MPNDNFSRSSGETQATQRRKSKGIVQIIKENIASDASPRNTVEKAAAEARNKARIK